LIKELVLSYNFKKELTFLSKIRQTPQGFVNNVCSKGKSWFSDQLAKESLQISFFNALNRL
jgi:hypothetical protein